MYEDRARSYIGANGALNEVVGFFRLFYAASKYRARREGVSVSQAVFNNMTDVYYNGLGALLVPAYEPWTTESFPFERTLNGEGIAVFSHNRRSTSHGKPKSNKQKRKELRKKKKQRAWKRQNGG